MEYDFSKYFEDVRKKVVFDIENQRGLSVDEKGYTILSEECKNSINSIFCVDANRVRVSSMLLSPVCDHSYFCCDVFDSEITIGFKGLYANVKALKGKIPYWRDGFDWKHIDIGSKLKTELACLWVILYSHSSRMAFAYPIIKLNMCSDDKKLYLVDFDSEDVVYSGDIAVSRRVGLRGDFYDTEICNRIYSIVNTLLGTGIREVFFLVAPDYQFSRISYRVCADGEKVFVVY